MAHATQGGRLPDPSQRMERRPSEKLIIESKKLYGFRVNDADLERTDWMFPASDSIRYSQLNFDDCRKFITNFQDQDGGTYYKHRTYLNLLYTPWEKSLLVNGTFEDTDLPVLAESHDLAQMQRWITDEYLQLWHNDSGGSAVLTDAGKAGFILQTPNDGGPFCSLSISEFQPTGNTNCSSGGLYVAGKAYSLDSLLANYSIQDSRCIPSEDDPVCRFLIMSMVLPIRILQKHSVATRTRLVDLAKEVTETEVRIAQGKVMQNTEADNKLLNNMNLEHMKIHRRWNFELELGASILLYFDTVTARDNGKNRHNIAACTKPMRDQVARQIRASESLKYDFDTIPRRIRNQSKAIFNLMIQRDNQLNLSIAEHSRNLNKINTEIATSSAKIAEESRRDSASMKTIAVLTLLFLPGTSIASIFSMNGMFLWNPPAGGQVVSKDFWIYFAVTIPLTMLILSGWLIFYYFYQKPQTRIIHDLEVQLPPLPPRIPGQNTPVKGEKYL